MGQHRFYVELALSAADVGATLLIEGDEARHGASAKRLTLGEGAEALDGAGSIAACVVERIEPGKGKRGPVVRLTVREVRRVPPVVPRVRVLAPIPKADRLSWMLEQLSQVGVASWTPLKTQRSIGSAEDLRPDRLARIAREAAKQCGRAHTLLIDEPADLDTLDLAAVCATGGVLVADAAGDREPIEPGAAAAWSVLIGPEGGLAPEEFARFEGAGSGLRRVALGPHVMRIETAALAAAAMLLRSAPAG